MRQTLADTLENERWILKEWKIHFLFSERVIKVIRKNSPLWYDDEATRRTWIDKIDVCFRSIESIYHTAGLLPKIGDRLFDEESGLIIQERTIDGASKTITFTLGL